MSIDPELKALEGLVLPSFADVGELRAWYRAFAKAAPANVPASRIAWSDRTIQVPARGPALSVRIYDPGASGPRPALVYAHAGSVVMGDLDTDHAACLRYAEHAACTVISVDYRLAPEFRFPVPAEDCYAALQWVAAHATELQIDPSRLAIGGSSSGGTLAAAAALMARDHGGPAPVLQLLIYPALDDRLDTPSMHACTEGTALTRGRVGWMWKHYLGGDGVASSSYAAPCRAQDLAGLPRTYIEVGALDPLRDECISFASRLLAAGVPTDLLVIAGAPHAFDAVENAGVTERAYAQRVAALRSAFQP